MSAVPAEVTQLIRAGQRFLLLAHLYPDGDVLGSQLGLGLALREAGCRADFACSHPVPEPFHFLPGAGEVQQWKEGRGDYDVVVTLDCPDPSRVGGLLEGCRQPGTRVLNIDHHGDNRRYGDVSWIEPSASATGEMVYDLLEAMGLPVTPDVAVNLFTAIVTDTGSFRYSNTSPKTFRIAARLVEAGASPADIAIRLYEARHLAGLHLLGRILQQVETNSDGTIAWVVIDRSQTESPDLLEAEDFITYPRSLRTAKVAVLFRELAGAVKVSLRAKGEVDVARIAARFGGGGHPNAAGVVLNGDLAQAKELVLGAVGEAVAQTR
ncbi:MAG: bifunctional oligoribonuclease/PAP phosphatase NrnA [Candidatus Rokubacteria bacterium]|nr:bifunctional oligoribonuclease/PAP phosphatase NrnA [Candidatus Rokubacteria bacterium]